MRVLSAFAALTLIGTATHVQAAVLTYDDIGVPGTYIPSSNSGFVEQGFQYSINMSVIDISASSPWASDGPAYSGNYAALNNYGGAAVIGKFGGGTFSFDSTEIKAWGGGIDNITITGYLQGNVVGIDSLNGVGSAWTLLSPDFASVDQVNISGGLFLLDNTAVNTSATPLPAALPLFATGLGAMGFLARRRKRKSGAAIAA